MPERVMDGCGGHSSMLVRRHGTSPLPRTAFAVLCLALLAGCLFADSPCVGSKRNLGALHEIVELFSQRSEDRLMANGYPHEFNCLKLRRLATFVVNRRRTNLPVSSELLHDSKIRTGLKQMGHEASPEVMA